MLRVSFWEWGQGAGSALSIPSSHVWLEEGGTGGNRGRDVFRKACMSQEVTEPGDRRKVSITMGVLLNPQDGLCRAGVEDSEHGHLLPSSLTTPVPQW